MFLTLPGVSCNITLHVSHLTRCIMYYHTACFSPYQVYHVLSHSMFLTLPGVSCIITLHVLTLPGVSCIVTLHVSHLTRCIMYYHTACFSPYHVYHVLSHCMFLTLPGVSCIITLHVSLFLGLFFIIPCIDTFVKADLRTVSFDVPPQEVNTRNSRVIMCQYLWIVECYWWDRSHSGFPNEKIGVLEMLKPSTVVLKQGSSCLFVITLGIMNKA